MRVLEFNPENMSYWIKKLNNMPQINARDAHDHCEAEAIVYALSEIEGLSHRFIENCLPQLQKGKMSDDQVETFLIEVATGLNDIVYLINDSRYFSDYIRFKISDI